MKAEEKPITEKYLLEFTDKVVFPRVEEIVEDKIDKKLGSFKDEILSSNDKLSGKLDKILTEQAAITMGFRRMEERLNYHESVLKVVAGKTGIQFNPPRP